jgi:CRP-like cAMP-binding protein
METIFDSLSSEPFLAGLAESHLRQLTSCTSWAVFATGYRVFAEGSRANRFWLIKKGRVDLRTPVPGHGDVVVESLGPGAVLGWSWLFEPYLWHFTAVAPETTFALCLNGPAVRRLCTQDPELGYELSSRFNRVVVERLQATRRRLLDLPTTAP